MTKPTILAVDNDPGVLASISRDLRSRYGHDYRDVDQLWNDEVAEPMAAGWPLLEVNTAQPVDVAAVVAFVRRARP